MTAPAVAVDGLTCSYGEHVAVDDVSFSVPAGRMVGIVGPNGAGKSTLIKAMVGTVDPDRGAVSFFGRGADEARDRVTYVPQRGDVDWDFPITAEGVVRQGRYRSVGLLGRFVGDDRRAVDEALKAVDIADLRDRQIGALSGGQRQRVFLARALAQGGDLFLMDEPFAGVDASTESEIVDVLRELVDAGTTIVVVHHDLTTIREYFDHLVLLNRRLVACGPTEEVFNPDALREAYGGRVAVITGSEDGRVAG